MEAHPDPADGPAEDWPARLPRRVRLVEVGPRDGLQNLDDFVPTADKVRLANRLLGLGFDRVEVTSFVHPRAIPQLADAEAVLAGCRRDGAAILVLVPNPRGAERALAGRPDQLNVVVSASEAHNRANVKRPVARSLEDLDRIAALALAAGVPVRLTIATSFGCPYEGYVAPEAVLAIARRGAAAGVAEICLGDTTGMAEPVQVYRLFQALAAALPGLERAVHLHNTRGSGSANLLAALLAGVTVVDAAVGGLGGCPYAPGASGNVATEDVVHLLEAMGIQTGVDLPAVMALALELETTLGSRITGQVARAGLSWQLGAPGRAD